jgi:hypothetical protein
MVEVWIPMLDGRWLVLPRHTQPEPDVQALLDQICITLPSQPPPRIKSSQLAPSSPNSLLCGEDLLGAPTDSEVLTPRQPRELRKTG